MGTYGMEEEWMMKKKTCSRFDCHHHETFDCEKPLKVDKFGYECYEYIKKGSRLKTIWKYKIGIFETTIDIPKNSIYLCVRAQFDAAWVHYIIDRSEVYVKETFYCVGVGYSLEDNFMDDKVYLDSVVLRDNTRLWHVFAKSDN